MSGITAFIYHNDYLKYDFGPAHLLQTGREKYTLDLLKELGNFNSKARLCKPVPSTEDEIALVQTRKYIDFVKKRSRENQFIFQVIKYNVEPTKNNIFSIPNLIWS